jgi:hypothetical protein
VGVVDGGIRRGEKYFAPTCVPTIANNDYPNNRPNHIKIPRHYPNVVLREYVIMTNHVYGIVQIVDGGGYGECMGEKYFAHTCVPTYFPTIIPTISISFAPTNTVSFETNILELEDNFVNCNFFEKFLDYE